MQLKIALAGIAALPLLALAAPAFTAGTHPLTGETLSDNQTFTYRMADELKTLDPQRNEETMGFHAIRDLFEGLLSQDENGNLIPGVATRWEPSNDNKRWTFHLRTNARWSNGDPVTAHDFVYAWRRGVDPETASPYAWYLELTSMVNASDIIAGRKAPETLGVRALDRHTLEVNLEQPLPYFPAMTTYATLFPAHRGTIDAHGDAWTKVGNIVSNGAYVLENRIIGERTTRVRNPMYWDADNVILERVVALIVNDPNQALTRYRAGELDYMDDLPAGQFPALKAELPNEATSVPRLCSYYYTFNLSPSGNSALQDIRVRQALSYAIDRSIIVDQVLKGGQTAAFNFTHPSTSGFAMPDIDYGGWAQRVRDARAARLMRAAGFGAGNPLKLEFIYNTSENHKAIATVISQMWKQKLGVEMKMTNFEWKTYLDIRGNQQFDVARSGWCGDYNEASTFLDLLTSTHGSNDGKYADPRVDQLMTSSRTADDPQPNYTQVEQILSREMPIAPIYHYANTFLLKEDIKGWPLNNVENNWYSKNHYRVVLTN